MNDRSASGGLLPGIAAWVLAAALLTPVASRADGLDGWFEGDLVPWLTAQLSGHPRFMGEPVRVAVFSGNEEDPTPDLLSAGLVGALESELSRRPDVRLVRLPAGPEWDDQRLPTRLPCLPAEEAYIVAVESSGAVGSMAVVKVRILDTHERQWVPGAAREWRGRLSGEQQRRLVQTGTRDDLRGHRDLPYVPGQEDLLAARAAHALGCALLAHPADGLMLWPDGDGDGNEEAGRIARLVPRYLARSGVVRVASAPSEANMLLAVDFQPLEGDMRQVWIALSPAGSDPELPSVRTSFYASVPLDAGSRRGPFRDPPVADDGLALELLPDDCAWEGCGDGGALEVRAPGSLHLELIAVTREGSVVRLYPSPCDVDSQYSGTGALRRPLSRDERDDLLTVFVVAARTPEAARELRREFDVMPAACETGLVRGAAVRGRLVTLERRLAPYADDLGWRRVRIAPRPVEPRVATTERG